MLIFMLLSARFRMIVSLLPGFGGWLAASSTCTAGLRLRPNATGGPAGHDKIPANYDNLRSWELTPLAATLTPSAWQRLRCV
jgi:hypothetical protein